MAAVDVGARDNPHVNDDLDDLFNYHVDDDIYKDVDTNMDAAPKPGQSLNGEKDILGDGLGLESEIKVRKARQPIPKLDDTRLLSQAGIPKLRRLTKERLRFKGKGHEFSDVARLLNLYQLWLDDLYPRAKFADGLAIIEKLGHTKRMQVMRKEWIREGRAKEVSNVEEEEEAPVNASSEPHGSGTTDITGKGIDQMTKGVDIVAGPQVSAGSLGASANNHAGGEAMLEESLFISDDDDENMQDGLGDDLDAIMAEDEARQAASTTHYQKSAGNAAGEEDFADEEAAMRDMENWT